MHDKLDGGFVKVLVATCCSSGYFSSLEVTDRYIKRNSGRFPLLVDPATFTESSESSWV